MGAFFDVKKDKTTTLMTNVLKEVTQLTQRDSEAKTGPLDFGPLVNHFMTTDVMNYAGSLTTPPCSSGVTWLFAKQPLDLDLDHWQAMKKIIKFNSRYVQNNLGDQNLIKIAAKQIPTIQQE
jgi:carbonic anhydrase